MSSLVSFPQHPWDELQLVVLHPCDVAWVQGAGGFFGESAVDVSIRPPPVPVILGGAEGVVIERPEGSVAESVVVVIQLVL